MKRPKRETTRESVLDYAEARHVNAMSAGGLEDPFITEIHLLNRFTDPDLAATLLDELVDDHLIVREDENDDRIWTMPKSVVRKRRKERNR